MAFEKLSEQLKDLWADQSNKIQESTWFNNLREKFEEQSLTVQRAIVAGACVLLALFLLSLPWSYISDSEDHMAGFTENRALIQGLLRASRSAKEISPLPPPMPVDALKARVEAILKENRLIPDQIGELQPLPGKPSKELAPPVVEQSGLAVQIKKLNLEQIMALSLQFHTMGNGTKLMGLDIIQTAGQSHYYDMIAHVVAFALPPATSPETEAHEKGGKKPPKRPAKKGDEESIE